MPGGDVIILLLIFLYPVLLLGYLVFLSWIPRLPRFIAYGAFCAVNLFAWSLLDALRVIDRNNASGQRAEEFFATLEAQLSSGSAWRPEYLEMPGYALPVLLSVLALAAIVGGGAVVWRKIHWYSRPLLIVSFVLSGFLFSGFHRVGDRRDVVAHNDLRRRTYALIAEKRAEHVTDRRMAETIAANRQGFSYSYETLAAERKSVDRILAALRELTPETSQERP